MDKLDSSKLVPGALLPDQVQLPEDRNDFTGPDGEPLSDDTGYVPPTGDGFEFAQGSNPPAAPCPAFTAPPNPSASWPSKEAGL